MINNGKSKMPQTLMPYFRITCVSKWGLWSRKTQRKGVEIWRVNFVKATINVSLEQYMMSDLVFSKEMVKIEFHKCFVIMTKFRDNDQVIENMWYKIDISEG